MKCPLPLPPPVPAPLPAPRPPFWPAACSCRSCSSSPAISKLTAISGTAGWFASIGLPMPTATTVVVGLVELLGGLAILVGFKTRIAAIVLAVFVLGATAIAHLDFSQAGNALMLQKNLAITGGLLLLAVLGAGPLSDRRPPRLIKHLHLRKSPERSGLFCFADGCRCERLYASTFSASLRLGDLRQLRQAAGRALAVEAGKRGRQHQRQRAIVAAFPISAGA